MPRAIRSRRGEAMYAALQSSLDTAFAGKEYRAVTAIHARNEAGEVHYHAHVLIGKFARDSARGRVFSLNSRSGGNTGKVRLKALKQAWKDSLDAALKDRLGLTVMQSSPFARPALTLADGTYVPALNRESRRIAGQAPVLPAQRNAVPRGPPRPRTSGGRTSTRPSTSSLRPRTRRRLERDRLLRPVSRDGAGRLKTYESRVATLKRIGYLTTDGRVTDAFTLHYRVHKGDHPELQRLRADLHKRAFGKKGSSGDHRGGLRSTGGAAGTAASRSAGASSSDQDGLLWEALHRDEPLLKRLERLRVSPG